MVEIRLDEWATARSNNMFDPRSSELAQVRLMIMSRNPLPSDEGGRSRLIKLSSNLSSLGVATLTPDQIISLDNTL